MIGPAAEEAGAVQEDHRHGAGRWLNLSCLGVGVVSLACCVYDLARPGHFVGDMYGLEVLVRLTWVVLLACILLVGVLMARFGESRRSRFAGLLGRLLSAGATVALVLAAMDVVESRRQDALHRTYPSRSTAELLRLAREKQDQFAVDELLVRKDPSSTQGLRDILLDEAQPTALRVCTAHALGEIGTQEARAVLDTARMTAPAGMLRTAIDYALETRMGAWPSVGKASSTQP
jgi:hypothetical protein